MARKKDGKKRLRTAKANAMHWDSNSLHELLAYLNWCIQAEVSFKTTVEDHLGAVTGKSYSFKQIERKLRGQWTGYGKSRHFEDVYLLGTAAFLDWEEGGKHIAEILVRLGPPPVARYRLRGGSSRRNARSHTLSTAAPSRRGTPTSAPKQASQLVRASHFQESPDTTNQSANITAPLQSTPTRLGNSASRRLADQASNLVVKGEGAASSVGDSLRGSTGPVSPELNENTASPLSSTSAQVSDMKADLERRKRDLLQREACEFTLRNRLAEMQSGLSRDQSDLVQELRNLKEILSEKNRLLQLSTPPPATQRVGAPAGDVKKLYDTLFHDMYDSCSHLGDVHSDEALPRQPDRSHGAAQHWAEKVSGWTLQHFITCTKAKAIPLEMALAALVGAAIFDLVFEPVFPEVLALESPLLHQYRRLIFIREGRRALQQIDHLALQGLTSQEYFATEIVPEKAKSLAAFIAQSLQFFFPRESDGSGRPSPDTGEFLADLGNLLGAALTLKVNFDHSMSRIKYVYPKPGDTFNANTMRQDIIEQPSSPSSHPCGQQRVRLCIFPALYALPPGNYDEDVDEATKHFSPNCNNCFTEAGVNDVQIHVLIARAIVLV